MADADITESATFILEQGMGKGAGMYVARLQIDDGETLTPGFKHIRAVFVQSFADVAAAYHIGGAASHATDTEAGAEITFSVGAIDDYTDDTGKNWYAVIIGDNTSGINA